MYMCFRCISHIYLKHIFYCLGILFLVIIFFANTKLNITEAAIITVDEVACTLSDAITASNNDADQGTCTVAGGDVSGSYGDDTINITTDSAGGWSVINDPNSNITIEGNDHTLNLGGLTQITVESPNAVTFQNIILSNGYGLSGGTIYAPETSANREIILDNVTIENGNADIFGGGIYMISGILTITDSTFDNNSAPWGPAIFATTNSFPLTVSISDTTISNNSGGFYTISLGQSNDENTPQDITTTFENIVFSDNTAYGSGVVIGSESFYSSGATADATFENIVFKNNESISSDPVGFDIWWEGTYTFENITMHGNSSASGIVGFSFQNQLMDITIKHVTLAENDATGVGIYMEENNHTWEPINISIGNNIIYDNTIDTSGEYFYTCAEENSPIFGDFTLLGGNMFESTDVGGGLEECTSDWDEPINTIGVDPMLDSLTLDNETYVVPLLPGSPAIDFGLDLDVDEDQRGESRPFDGDGDGIEGYDSGAYEYAVEEDDQLLEEQCTSRDCLPQYYRFACKNPSADPYLTNFFLRPSDPRFFFYVNNPFFCRFAEFDFDILPSDEDIIKNEELLDLFYTTLDLPRIIEELAKLLKEDETVLENAACPVFSGSIRPGQKLEPRDGHQVARWQLFLKKYYSEPLKVSGMYVTETQNAIERFQERYAEAILRPWTWGPSTLQFRPTRRIYKLTNATGNYLMGCPVENQWIEDAKLFFDISEALKNIYNLVPFRTLP